MPENSPLWPHVGRTMPAGGAHIFLGQPNIFFVTVNAKDRVPWIGQGTVQNGLEKLWRNEATAWLVGYYLLMPDHLHFFCAPRELHFGIDDWVTFWKRQFSRAHPDTLWRFQRRSFHHRIRDAQEYTEKWIYVRENPVRHGLAKAAEEWPFQGIVHKEVRW